MIHVEIFARALMSFIFVGFIAAACIELGYYYIFVWSFAVSVFFLGVAIDSLLRARRER